MSTLGERWAALRKNLRETLGRSVADRTVSRAVERSREALGAATEPLRRFARAERERFEAARRRLHAAPPDAPEDPATPPPEPTEPSVTEHEGPEGDGSP